MKMKSIFVSVLFAGSLCFSSSCANKKRGGSSDDFAADGGGSDFGDANGSERGGAGNYSDFSSGNLPSRDERYSYFNASTGQFEPVLFAFDSFSISSQEMRKIDAVADYLGRKGGEVLVAGFTDSVGTEVQSRLG